MTKFISLKLGFFSTLAVTEDSKGFCRINSIFKYQVMLMAFVVELIFVQKNNYLISFK